MSRLDAYISRYGYFCANDDDDDTTDYFTPCACARGNNNKLITNGLGKGRCGNRLEKREKLGGPEFKSRLGHGIFSRIMSLSSLACFH